MKEEKNPTVKSTFWRKRLHNQQRWQSGMSLIEILLVVAIIGVLAVATFIGYSRQVSRARDAERKGDLDELRIAFEDYYNDNSCYPDLDTLTNCGGADLDPYLKEVPCDPYDQQPYKYFAYNSDVCTGYRVLVQLENPNDPHIESAGCDPINGCYYDDPSYNYGIAMGGEIVGGDWDEEGAWVIGIDGVCVFYNEAALEEGDCPSEYQSYAACFAVSGCTGGCTQEEVPLYLRCER